MISVSILIDIRSRMSLLLLLCIFCGLFFSIGVSAGPNDVVQENDHNQRRLTNNDDENMAADGPFQKLIMDKDTKILPEMLSALDVLQGQYFAIWQGIYPQGIDWTSAVMGTFVAGALNSLTKSLSALSSPKMSENVIDKYFTQLIGFYFGQNAVSLRQQAYDDMLWVVLGWLETVKFIDLHYELHYSNLSQSEWYGRQYKPAFAHRARLFWELASQGWNTTLCGGGMIWNPRLLPYKNAITNELYIAASISMYLYFPGDSNQSPFMLSDPAYPPRDEKYLKAATDAYDWLKRSNMTDSQGLYVDGYHISNLSESNNTVCDSRNEMVYTYNQGVLLTGQRGLYAATAAKSYLEDGHKLISDVIAATGYDLKNNVVLSPPPKDGSTLAKWYGLGRNGVLEEACDSTATCSQDSQTFKGIFFHHLTAFCSDLSQKPDSHTDGNFKVDRKWHTDKCSTYTSWIKRNAEAALDTKDKEGRYGMWWGAQGLYNNDTTDQIPQDAVDYRNLGVPENAEWRGIESFEEMKESMIRRDTDGDHDIGIEDPNVRGRGRTLETQGGGLSVLRSFWEIADR